jgi:outer membrane protein OmpA-like peptidoglycan-associated protein
MSMKARTLFLLPGLYLLLSLGLSYAQSGQINLIASPINGFVKEPLGPEINSGQHEILPIISPSGRYLFFARYSPTRNLAYGSQKEDIWFAYRQTNGRWSKAEEIGPPLNNSGSNAVFSVSVDENTLFLANRYDAEGGFIGGGLSLTQRTEEGWAMPKDIRILNFYNDSRIAAQNFCFSADQEVMIMSVQREDTYGSIDLYLSFRQQDGSYGRPINMGPALNSAGTEYAPFLAADNQTIYFASDGHAGYGDSDIFVSRRLDNSWRNWSEPENLGPEVNGKGADAFFTVPASGEFAYFSSRNAAGNADLYRIHLAVSARPKPTIVVRGQVKDQVSKEPIPASIQFFEKESGEVMGQATAAPGDGSYQFVLPAGKHYVLRIDRAGYYVTTEQVDLASETRFRELIRDIYLMPNAERMAANLASGLDMFRLDNVLFEFAKADLRKDDKPNLDRLVSLLKDRPEIRIEVQGHTDNTGADARNQELSEERASSVVKYLIEKGIPAERLSSKGFGATKPIASNATESGRAQNRRVEIKIIQ